MRACPSPPRSRGLRPLPRPPQVKGMRKGMRHRQAIGSTAQTTESPRRLEQTRATSMATLAMTCRNNGQGRRRPWGKATPNDVRLYLCCFGRRRLDLRVSAISFSDGDGRGVVLRYGWHSFNPASSRPLRERCVCASMATPVIIEYYFDVTIRDGVCDPYPNRCVDLHFVISRPPHSVPPYALLRKQGNVLLRKKGNALLRKNRKRTIKE
jgi:hypothetical protein